MFNPYDDSYADKVEHEVSTTPPINKVLCILEGGDELSFIKQVYEVYNHSIECQAFVNNKIKLSYGSQIIEWQGETAELRVKSKIICNFRGGDTQDGKAPEPILRSLLNEELDRYKAIIIMFDKDRDANNVVEIKAREILEEYSYKILFLSSPCFEKESMTFFMNEEVQNFIDTSYESIEGSACLWYKQNYNKCLAFNRVGNGQKLATLIDKLDINYLENTQIDKEMSKLINFIKIHT